MINGLCSSLLLAREPHRPCDSANLDSSKELVVLMGFRPTKPSETQSGRLQAAAKKLCIFRGADCCVVEWLISQNLVLKRLHPKDAIVTISFSQQFTDIFTHVHHSQRNQHVTWKLIGPGSGEAIDPVTVGTRCPALLD